MTAAKRLYAAYFVVMLVVAAFVVPWALEKTAQATKDVSAIAQMRADAEAVTKPDPVAVAAAKAEAEARAAAQKAADEQTARIKAELDKLAVPKPAPTPEPPKPAYSIVPTGSAELVPLEGWVDQPNKDRPGRVHTNLMVRHVKPSAKPRQAARAPCLTMVARPAERIERPYGWVQVPARTIPVPCGK